MFPKIKKFIRNSIAGVISSEQTLPASMKNLATFKAEFDTHLNAFVEQKIIKVKKIGENAVADFVLDHTARIVNHGGKRIRPYISSLAYVTEGGADIEKSFTLGVGIELLHSFALIHDDIIDGGIDRHGILTIHKQMEKNLQEYERGNKQKIGESLALLSGDLLFNWSHEIMMSADNSIRKAFGSMVDEVIAGQMIDVSMMLSFKVPSETISKKNELKTARYTFVSPMQIGSLLAGSTRRLEVYEKIGLLLGQAFQIQDDVLDIIGDETQMGKKNFIDIADGQHTFVTQYIFDSEDGAGKDLLLSVFGKPLDEHSRHALSRLFASSGAIKFAQEKAQALITEAKKQIELSDIPELFKPEWLSFVSLVEKRNS